MADEKDVQVEKVSEETTSKEETKVEETKEETKSLTEERVQQLIAEATSTAKEAGKREMQGIKDREVADANRLTRLAQNETASYKTSFSGLDEDTQQTVELARYREQEKSSQSFAQEETKRQQDEAFYQRMNEGVLVYLDNLGIPRDEKRLDWGTGAKDYVEARNRLDASVAKIMNENKKVTEAKQGEDFKNLESKLRKDLGLDSVDTTAGGGKSDSDDFHSRVGNPDHKLTKKDMQEAKERGIIS